MTKPSVVLLHGFASSGGSRKAIFLKDKFLTYPLANFYAIDFNPTLLDFEYMTITGMINRLRQYVLDRQLCRIILIGSSMGALVALHYSHRYGGVKELLLLAPMLAYWPGEKIVDVNQWRTKGKRQVHHFAFGNDAPLRFDFHLDGLNYREHIRPPVPSTIIHGVNDDIIPIENSRDYEKRFGDLIQLIEVQSDHRLADQLVLLWDEVKRIL